MISDFVLILAGLTTAVSITGGVTAWAWAAAGDWRDRRAEARKSAGYEAAVVSALALFRAIDDLDPYTWRPRHRRRRSRQPQS